MVNNASIDWYFAWPEQALYAVASVFISPDVRISCVHCTKHVYFMCFSLISIVFIVFSFSTNQNPLIPDARREQVVTHIVMVHQSVGRFSKEFMQKLRRANYVTPKHYLDYINTYLKLLDQKDKFILSLVSTCTTTLFIAPYLRYRCTLQSARVMFVVRASARWSDQDRRGF